MWRRYMQGTVPTPPCVKRLDRDRSSLFTRYQECVDYFECIQENVRLRTKNENYYAIL